MHQRHAAHGAVKLGHNAQVAYFSQHADDLPERATVLEALLAGTDLGTSECRTLLGRFLFRGDEVERKVDVLSGGERKRLLLARQIGRAHV